MAILLALSPAFITILCTFSKSSRTNTFTNKVALYVTAVDHLSPEAEALQLFSVSARPSRVSYRLLSRELAQSIRRNLLENNTTRFDCNTVHIAHVFNEYCDEIL